MMEVVASHIFLSLSYKCFINLGFFILVIVKQYVSFNNPQYFHVSQSFSLGCYLASISISH